jgi:hypothetical protein
MTQICVWAPEHAAELVRQICTRVAEPTSRGQALRSKLMDQLDRRRTICGKWSGVDWDAEIDFPFVGPWWYMRNIGGRITGLGTHVELTPEEAADLKHHLSWVCQNAIKEWAQEHELIGCTRDDTGVATDISAREKAAREGSTRPANEEEFAANEAKIARSVTEAAKTARKPLFKDSSVIEYEGAFGLPSFCQIAHNGDRVQFALIHMANGGTSPTNMFETLATFMRQRFYPEVDARSIDWYDVYPGGVYLWKETLINAVSLEQSNGIYSKPAWNHAKLDPSDDWHAFVDQVISRSKKIHRKAEDADLDEIKKPVAR